MIDPLKVNFFLLVVSIEISCIFYQVNAKFCQVHPSEYAYYFGHVNREESDTANCREYPSNLQPNVFTNQYIHCNGTERRLTDSDHGSDQYFVSKYYVWGNRTRIKLLFAFPKRVNLTTITLHYYSDSVRGLPNLRFFAVPNDFDVWNALTPSYSYVDISAVPPGGEPGGHRSKSITVNFRTRKILMYKHTNADFQLAVSEVEFFNCSMLNRSVTTSRNPILSTAAEDDFSGSITDKVEFGTKSASFTSTATDGAVKPSDGDSNSSFITTNFISHTKMKFPTNSQAPSTFPLAPTVSAIIIVILLTLATMLGIVLVYKRKCFQQKANIDGDSYSTLCRESARQPQPQLHHTTLDVYNQIQLSPSTGQAELIPGTEIENIHCISQHKHNKTSNVDTEQPQNLDKGTVLEQPNYVIPNKNQKKKKLLQTKGMESTYCIQTNVSEKERENSSNETDQNSVKQRQALEELYTSIKKIPKGRVGGNEEEVPPIPPHTVEELYTAVQKKSKCIVTGDEAEAPPIPPHTIEELYTAVHKTKT